jgi:hypothetical protein
MALSVNEFAIKFQLSPSTVRRMCIARRLPKGWTARKLISGSWSIRETARKKVAFVSGLPILTLNDIRKWGPCYDPSKFAPNNWSGTLLDILKEEKIPVEDRIWCAAFGLPEKEARLFACWCAREALEAVPKPFTPDPISIAAIAAAEKFANGEISAEELSAARSAAESAARSAAESAARSAAWSAESAARSAARSAALSAAESAARSAALSAAESAAAWSAARDKQLERLIEVVTLLMHI